MRTLNLVLLAGAAFAALTPAAFAADLLQEPPVAPVVDNSSPMWNGGYIGAFIQGQTAPSAYGLGGDLGVNALMNGILIGGELEAVYETNSQWSAQATGRIGVGLGDAAILYAYTGIGTRATTNTYAPLGGGVEFKIADNLGLKTEAQCNFDLDNSAENSAAVKVGLNWHF